MGKKWMYKQDCIGGEVFDLGPDHKKSAKYAELKEDGWLDSPKTLDKPKPKVEEISAERAASMSPDAMADQVKGYGYHVFTDIELKIKLGKAISEASDDVLCSEVDKRGLVKAPVVQGNNDIDELQFRFLQDPKSLIIEEHLELGKALGAKLRINFGEDTMIKKIQEKLDEA